MGDYLTEKAHMILCSGRYNQQVADGEPGENSPFLTAFIEALTYDQRDAVTCTGIFAVIQERLAGSIQTPLLGRYSESSGEVIFFLRDS